MKADHLNGTTTITADCGQCEYRVSTDHTKPFDYIEALESATENVRTHQATEHGKVLTP